MKRGKELLITLIVWPCGLESRRRGMQRVDAKICTWRGQRRGEVYWYMSNRDYALCRDRPTEEKSDLVMRAAVLHSRIRSLARVLMVDHEPTWALHIF